MKLTLILLTRKECSMRVISKVEAGTFIADLICGTVVMLCVAGAVAVTCIIIEVIEKL